MWLNIQKTLVDTNSVDSFHIEEDKREGKKGYRIHANNWKAKSKQPIASFETLEDADDFMDKLWELIFNK